MRCVNCGFHNMPGSVSCGRCSTSLGLSTAVMDVHPPRASPRAERLRRLVPARAYYRTRDALNAQSMLARALNASASMPPLPIFVRLLVPGWSHFHMGQRLRGHLFLWGFVACLLPTLLFYGSTWGSIWLGLAFSVHSSAALDVITQTFADAGTRDRIARSIAVSILLWVLLYWPATALVGHLVQPHTVQVDVAPFRRGDVVFVDPRTAPRRGDVVLYEVGQIPDLGEERGHAPRRFFVGECIDRILAGPGDRVRCEAGRLLVNGSPSPWLPLNARPLPAALELTVPPDRFLVLPSGAPGLDSLADPGLWTGNGMIARADIFGRVTLRSYPLSRFGRIR